MLVVGLQGSPRKKGNTKFLLSTFMTAAEKFGARTQVIDVTQKEIIPCNNTRYVKRRAIARLKMTSGTKYIHCCARPSWLLWPPPSFFIT